jgi:hypothetical protein
LLLAFSKREREIDFITEGTVTTGGVVFPTGYWKSAELKDIMGYGNNDAFYHHARVLLRGGYYLNAFAILRESPVAAEDTAR